MVRTSMCWQIGKTMQHGGHAPTLSEDEEHCWSLGQGESGISDDPVLLAAGSGEVRWDHIFKFHMASGWLRRFSAFSLQEWIWTLVQKQGKIWKMTRILADGTQALAEASSNSSDQSLLICFWRPEPCFRPFLQTRLPALSLFHSSCLVISHPLTADTLEIDRSCYFDLSSSASSLFPISVLSSSPHFPHSQPWSLFRDKYRSTTVRSPQSLPLQKGLFHFLHKETLQSP